MGDVISLDDHRPHIAMHGASGNSYVIPLQMFLDIIEGDIEVTDFPDYEDVMRTVLYQWLGTVLEDVADEPNE